MIATVVNGGNIVASHFNGTSWSNFTLWTNPTPGSWSTGFFYDLASNGTGYAAAYRFDNSTVMARFHDGTAWGAGQTTLRFSSLTISIGRVNLASNGTGYAAVWDSHESGSGGTHRVYARVHDGTAWGSETNLVFNNDIQGNVILTSNGSGYLAAWRFTLAVVNSAGVGTALYDGGWSGANLSSTTQFVSHAVQQLASNGTGYAATWNQDGDLYAAVHNGTSWGASTALDTGPYRSPINLAGLSRLASNGTDYAAIWDRTDNTGPFVSISSGTTWGAAAAIDVGADAAKEPFVARNNAGGFQASWSESNTIYTRRHGGAWSSATNLVQGTFPGSASNPKMATSAGGTVVAVWEQFSGAAQGVYANVFQGGAWGTAFQISSVGRLPEVATNGTTFVVVWEQDQDIYTRRYTIATSTWDAAVAVQVTVNGSIDPAIASNGSGYMVVFSEFSGPTVHWSSSADGASWTAPASFAATGEDSRLASNGSGYALVYRNNANVNARVHNGTTWGGSTSLGTQNSSFSPQFSLASNGSQYAVAWENSSNAIQARVYNGTAWAAATTLSVSGTNTNALIASDGAGYLVVWDRFSAKFSSAYNGTAWGAPLQLLEAGAGGVASNGAGYAFAYPRTDGTFLSMTTQYFFNGIWGRNTGFLESHAGDASNAAVSAGANYSVAWRRATGIGAEIWATAGN